MDWNTILINFSNNLWLLALSAVFVGAGKGIAFVIDSITRRRTGVVGENYILPSHREISYKIVEEGE